MLFTDGLHVEMRTVRGMFLLSTVVFVLVYFGIIMIQCLLQILLY